MAFVAISLLILIPGALIATASARSARRWGVIAAVAGFCLVLVVGLPVLAWLRLHVWDPDPGCENECGGRLIFYVAWYFYGASAAVGGLVGVGWRLMRRR